jgi:hypothetical protein
MITRGYYIGQIIDELTSITEKVKTRAKLGLTDLHLHLEDFYKDVLNIAFGYNLENLNKERSNSPGLDLGDENNGIAFQITGTKTTDKVNQTLNKSARQAAIYPKIKILTLQNKQNSYSIKEEFMVPFSFTTEDIWDVNDIFKQVMHLPIDKLQQLSDLISKEVARVTIELEIPDENGKYQTNIDSYIEKIPKERFKGISSYFSFHSSKEDQYDAIEEEVEEDFNNFIKTLKKLPRISRQFYAFLYERSEWDETEKYINADYLQRICSFPDMDGELRLLDSAGLCLFMAPDDNGESPVYLISLPSKSNSEYFSWEFNEYMESNKINIENVLVSLDFSDFQ